MKLQKASELVIAEAKVGEAPEKDEEAAPKKKRATKKEAAAEDGEEAPKPKRTRKKKTDETEEPKAE